MKENIFKKLRNKKELTLVGLAKELTDMGFPIDRQVIGRIENETQSPSADIIKAYCKYFNVTSDYLLGLNPCEKNDATYSAISATLGLSDIAIDTIKDFKETEELNDIFHFFNNLVEDYEIFNRLIWNIYLYVNSEQLEPATQDKDGNFISFSQDEIYYFLNDESSIAGGYIKFDTSLYEGLAQKQILDLIAKFKKTYNKKGD